MIPPSLSSDLRLSATNSGWSCLPLATDEVNLRLLHPTRVGCSKTTGPIQNREDFFGPGIAEVPTLFCVKTGLEFGAQSGAGILAVRELPKLPNGECPLAAAPPW
jgi:hypothetical protein